jgi:hypothetical protein
VDFKSPFTVALALFGRINRNKSFRVGADLEIFLNISGNTSTTYKTVQTIWAPTVRTERNFLDPKYNPLSGDAVRLRDP